MRIRRQTLVLPLLLVATSYLASVFATPGEEHVDSEFSLPETVADPSLHGMQNSKGNMMRRQ